MLNVNLKNRKSFTYVLGVFHNLSLLFTFLLTELFFFSSKGVDFPVYFKYLEYFIYENIKTVNNQGLLYYYLNALSVFARKGDLNSINSVVFFNSTIQITNFLLYLIGTFGLYKLLKSFKYKTNTILIALTLMHWMPKLIEMRVLMKPEIIAFSFLPWIILGIDNYFKNNDRSILFFSLLPISILITSKGSIAGMILFFLFLKYISKITKDNFKELLIFLIIFVVLCIGIGYENYTVHELSFFNITVSDNYQNVANTGFLTNLNISDLILSPKLGFHNNSFLGITLLDTFGDYYKVNLGSKDNYFAYYQINFFENSEGEDLSRNYLELIFAIIFIFLIFKVGKENNKINIFILSPMIGIIILLLNSFGIPSMNFDPLKGDTMKVSYYIFFIALSLVFLISDLLNNKSESIKALSILLIIPMFFLLGFPKSNYKEIANNIDTKIEMSLFCKPISLFVESTSSDDCTNIIKQNCEYNLYSNEAQNIEFQSEESVPSGFTRIYREDTILGEIVPNERLDEFINEGGYSLTPVLDVEDLKFINPSEALLIKKGNNQIYTDNKIECSRFLEEGYIPHNDIKFVTSKIPYVNILYFIGSMYLVVSLSRKERL